MAESLGSLLKRHRTSASLTQEELAERAEVSARTVSDVERGLRTRIYRDTAARLADALGLDEGSRRGFEAAARGRPIEPPVSGAVLPMPPTELIGRAREMDVLLSALDRPGVRLVTLTGPGGIGKTRIALEAARRGSAFFVQLGAVTDPASVVSLVARAVGVSGATEPSVDAIAERLGDDAALIVLDTCEHVLAAAADVAALIAACPGAKILATSREALRVRGEHEVAIPTLELPASPVRRDVESAPASILFLQRAHAVEPGLVLDESAAAAVAEICRRVNGLPLAIELAAARVKHLPLDELRDQLDNRLSVLTGGARDLPRRQRTMRDTVAWSYELLDDAEQALFRDLSIFAGGFTLDAAAAVHPGTDVLAGVSALVDKSLVVREGGSEPRYGMLDVVREFGAELRSGDEADRRHVDYFLSLAERAEPALGGVQQRSWLRRLAEENDNIRAAMETAVRRRDVTAALWIGGAVWRSWLLRGDLSEGRRSLRLALDADPLAEALARAKALWGAAWLAYHQGDFEAAERCGDEMMRTAASSPDPVQRRNALTIRGIVAVAYGRYEEARGVLEEAVELLRPVEPAWLLATSLLNLGMASIHAGDDAGARSALDEARARYAELGDDHYLARTILYSGYAALMRDDRGEAASLIAESLVAFWELDDLWGTTEALEGMACIAAAAGEAEPAARLAGSAEVLREKINARPFPSDRAVMDRTFDGVRPSVPDEDWERWTRRGNEMSAEETVDLALAVAADAGWLSRGRGRVR